MKYEVVIKKPFKYIRSYNLLRRPNDAPNAASRFVQRMVDRFVLKKQQEGS